MSIIPGIENTAPERTETSSGLVRVAEALAGALLERVQVLQDLLPQPLGPRRVRRRVSTQASVVTVKPSGTRTPIRAISATLAPLPPSSERISAEPSARS